MLCKNKVIKKTRTDYATFAVHDMVFSMMVQCLQQSSLLQTLHHIVLEVHHNTHNIISSTDSIKGTRLHSELITEEDSTDSGPSIL